MTPSFLDQSLTNQQPSSSPTFSGAILGLQGDVLHGWAMNGAKPDERPVVEVLIDGISVAFARADRYEPGAAVGDQYHGFVIQLRQGWLDGARTVNVRIANQPIMLEGQIRLPTVLSKDSAEISSQVWHTGGLRIGGWCWDPQAPHRHVQISVRKKNQMIAKSICNAHHQALAYRTTSDHGFTIDLPWELADGEVHVLDIIDDRGQPLAGSPISLCCWPEGIEGLIEKLDPAHDSSTKELLLAVAREQNIRLPKSAGWESYPQWFMAYQQLGKKKTPALQGKLGLLLISEGDTALEQDSLASLGASRADVHELTIAPAEDLVQALQVLIAAGCDRILPVQAGDRLAAHAVPYLSKLIDDGNAWGFSDCDRDSLHGKRSSPWLKPAWDIDFFIGADIYTPGAIFSIDIVQKALSLLANPAFEKTVCWNYLVAGIALATYNSEATVAHLPRVLYHRANTTHPSPELDKPSIKRLQAVEWLCESIAPGTKVSRIPAHPALLRAHWPLPECLPRVTLIVPTRDQCKLLRACIEGLLNETDYPNLEIIVVDNQSTDPETLDYLKNIEARGVLILEHPYPFNYSTINNRAAHIATGEVIGLLNNDIEIIESHWLKEMVSQLYRPNVGIVGAKLLWPNRMVQHGGVVVGVNGLAAHAGNYLEDADAGYLGTNQITRKQSAVTAACLLVQKSLFTEVGGLNQVAFPVAFNDVDLCLRIHKKGLAVIITTGTKLIHAESASRGKDITREKQSRAQREQLHFLDMWRGYEDPWYHPLLSHDYLTAPYGGLRITTPEFKVRIQT